METFLSVMIQVYGQDLLRYKGVLNGRDEPRRMIFQGVHMLMGGTSGKPWEPGEAREQRDGVHRAQAAAAPVRGGPRVLRGVTMELYWFWPRRLREAAGLDAHDIAHIRLR